MRRGPQRLGYIILTGNRQAAQPFHFESSEVLSTVFFQEVFGYLTERVLM